MKKSLLELQYLEEKRINQELRKIDNAEEYYDLLNFFNTLSVTLFIMDLLIVMVAAILEFLIIETNGLLVNCVVLIFMLLSLSCLIASVFYKHKTMEVLKRHYETN